MSIIANTSQILAQIETLDVSFLKTSILVILGLKFQKKVKLFSFKRSPKVINSEKGQIRSFFKIFESPHSLGLNLGRI